MTRTAVYRHYDDNERLLYVGCTTCPNCRYGFHRSQSDWGHEVVKIEIEWHPTREAALAAEAEQIQSLNPPHNREAPSNKGRTWTPTTGHLFVQAYLKRTGMSLVEFANAIDLSVASARKYAERVSHPQSQRAALICYATDGYVPTDSWARHGLTPFHEVTAEEAAENLEYVEWLFGVWAKGNRKNIRIPLPTARAS